MPLSRAPRSRLPLSAAVLLGMVLALLVLACPLSADVRGADAGPVASAPGEPQGCGKGAPDEDRGAHPSPPPRPVCSYEPVPVAYAAYGTGAGQVWSGRLPGGAPDRGPPPPVPPTPVDLSILLRV
ncbi:hypothetical protein [Streptomyces clavuligerus]|uniref:Uncharacterized protein n=1 Tax=Streptomyces clavuligerus TaxID=1901 RepID=B5GT41_STRCL|nr:hypothetical protein [Streptomyces clavuligerus]ANW19080.1 hypothetical protein BB341_13030 [Streptomyces clavuligerus]AXU13662.1 hypothetical protein D1794_13505 [Streptomyces clavuligerus]EDY49487.1 hypothetical protein SSCG_02515 [Streptomyces clavuligerus]EFG08184.1 Hypothetical protein SCLAV_3113 [Streptomyces clavuligerus]MBY6303632.1 hypothetical protein [Streptomyces clavuligerus]